MTPQESKIGYSSEIVAQIELRQLYGSEQIRRLRAVQAFHFPSFASLGLAEDPRLLS
jgi:hypothetical protein